MVWKTNFDQIPYQEFLESRLTKSATVVKSAPGVSAHHPVAAAAKQFDIHAKQLDTHRDNNSPLTIPVNETLSLENDQDLYATENVHQARPSGKKLAQNANLNANNSNTVNVASVSPSGGVGNANAVPANIANTLQHIVKQLDILTQVIFRRILFWEFFGHFFVLVF